MDEVGAFLQGERDYSKIRGDTGPLVYPAGFVYIYSVLYWLTGAGRNIRLAQYGFACLYSVSFGLVSLIYRKSGRIPLYVLGLLMISKRLHSIYVLRLFNDPFAMMFLYISILLLLNKQSKYASLFYSLALSVKMNVLLFAPALLLILFQQASGSLTAFLSNILIIVSTQLVLGYPFILEYPNSYTRRSFNFSRVFEYKWTVNWRMLDESVFLHPAFAKLLLVCTVLLILLFAQSKWTVTKYRLHDIIIKMVKQRGIPKIPEFNSHQIINMLFTSNLIGIIFSRSLHYQFYSWYFWTVPYLFWNSLASIFKSPVPRILITTVLVICLEYCWNVYPSTTFSSILLLVIHIFLLSLLLISNGLDSPTVKTKRK